MKKTIKLGLIAATMAITSTLSAAPVSLTQVDLDNVKAEYPALLGVPALTLTKGVSRDKFKQIEVEAKTKRGTQKFNVFIVDGVEDTVFFGKAYGKGGKTYDLPLNNDLINSGVAFTMGNGKENIYIVTDPDCPWCKKLESGMSEESLAKYKINIIPMPLAMHKNSKAILYWILSATNDQEKTKRLHDYMTGKDTKSWVNFKITDKQKEGLDKVLESSLSAAMELGAKGTPAIYNSKMGKMSFQSLVK